MTDPAINLGTGDLGAAPRDSIEVGAEKPHDHGVPHQFDNAEQQHEAVELGMWAFLATEVLFFGALFLGYIVYRYSYHPVFALGSHQLWVSLGAINTAVLLCSSLSMALAVHAAATGERRKLVRFLLLTCALGAVFLGIKFIEYTIDYHEGLVPYLNFHPQDNENVRPALEKFAERQNVPVNVVARNLELFFVFYFCMTMLHAIHMIIGIAIILLLTWLAHRGKFTPRQYNPIEMTGLYWHFVDIVWVFLFPMLYLLRH